MEPTTEFRTFIAIKIPSALLDAIGQVQRKLAARPGGQVVRWTKREQIHLTLEFLGNVEASRVDALLAAVRQACASSGPFSLSIAGLGCFPNPQRPSVTWLGVQGEVDRLKALQTAIHNAVQGFGDHQESREFAAHLTIGRIRTFVSRESQRVANLIEAGAVGVLGEWRVTSVAVIRSELKPEGPEYTELAEVALGAG